MNGSNKLECYITVNRKGLMGQTQLIEPIHKLQRTLSVSNTTPVADIIKHL
jgi:hypothetical protein